MLFVDLMALSLKRIDLRLRLLSFVTSFDRLNLCLCFLQLGAELLYVCFKFLGMVTHGCAPFVLDLGLIRCAIEEKTLQRPLAPRAFSTLACCSGLKVVLKIVPP